MKKENPIGNKDNSLLINDLYEIVQELLLQGEAPREGESCLWVIGLSQHHQLLLMELLSATEIAELQTTEVFQAALHKHANFVLICQRAYDKEWLFGEEDLLAIRQLLQVGYLIKLPILDYLLLGDQGYYSLAQSGALEEWQSIENAVPLTIQKAEELAQEAVEQAKHTLESSYYQDKEEIALHLYEEGLDLDQIIAITGLPEAALLILLELDK
ncbi:MAG: JAB domain-containing protein [Aureispira sp.]